MAVQCPRVRRLAKIAASHGARLVGARPPELVEIPVTPAHRPAGWTRSRVGLVMKGPGRLRVPFTVPHEGVWEMWLRGQIMRAVHLGVDGNPIGSVAAQLGGNSLNPNNMAPLGVRLSAGRHLLSIARAGASFAPGDGGFAFVDRILLTPAAASEETLSIVPAGSWHSLCGQRFDWLEVTRS
jgi:hypothetical protein